MYTLRRVHVFLLLLLLLLLLGIVRKRGKSRGAVSNATRTDSTIDDYYFYIIFFLTFSVADACKPLLYAAQNTRATRAFVTHAPWPWTCKSHILFYYTLSLCGRYVYYFYCNNTHLCKCYSVYWHTVAHTRSEWRTVSEIIIWDDIP